MKKQFTLVCAASAVLFGTTVTLAQNNSEPYKDTDTKNVKPDNSGVNKRDRADYAKTADTQMQATDRDVELTRQIREQLTKDNSLSVNAQNIKIVTFKGRTTLKGPVESAAEKAKVESYAKNIVGAKNLTNQIEIITK